ncbi:DUF3618 domain-containing protein [Defluviimonas sp. WL0002]|uniref:DUF3618 domain-containing protein n=1 Tax=Albidovulum marisflavi TaxID=2984159 RepID=A0ABT2ZCI4_9RHOB|nr:DUF3618 domain-containing protein [Defluviimonas sp. WL0002]MCV2868860.1 DUF3618 domain-containing protein [Defluviimonas sp. WL0002]
MAHQTDVRDREAELERDRASLASTLNELQDRVSVEHLAREALGMIRSNANTYASSIDSAIRANPMAVALTCAGVAWLIFGGRKNSEAGEEGSAGQHSAGGASPRGHLSRGYDPYASSGDHRWSSRIDELRQRASDALDEAERKAKGFAEDQRDYLAERGRILSDFTADLADSLRDGLEDLSAAARDRVVQARQKAYAASLRAGRSARAGGREAGHLIEEHPLVAGAIALALGAAFAAALPRTRTEDRAFGAESDRLMAAAADALREERERLSHVAQEFAQDVKSAAKDAAGAAAAGAKADSASDRQSAAKAKTAKAEKTETKG